MNSKYNWLLLIQVSLVGLLPGSELHAQRYKRIHQDVLDKITSGKPRQAQDRLLELAEGDFDDAETQFMLTIACAQLGETDKALQALHAAIDKGLPPGRFAAGPRELLQPIQQTAEFERAIARFDGQPVHGPMLGNITDRSVQVWLRTAQEADVAVSVRPASDKSVEIKGQAKTLAEDDYTAVIRLDGLKADTPYGYALAINGKPVNSDQSDQRFRTAPRAGSKCKFQLVFGGGAGYVPKNERMWNTIRSFHPDLLLLLGDNVYIDHPQSPAMQRYCYYRRQSRPEFRRLIAQTPVYAIWDDHDFGTNDCTGGPDIDKPAWKLPVWKVFRDNWVNPPYGGGREHPGCYFDFYHGDVHFVLLDGRYYRTGRGTPDGTMLGPVQKQWLLNTIKQSRGTFKVLISPVPWVFTAKGNSNDTWNGFRSERDEVFDYLAKHKIDGVVLISADRHRSDLWKIEREGSYDLYEFNSSRLTNQGIAGTMPHAEFSYNKKPSFGLVSFDTQREDPTVRYQVVTIDREVVHGFTLPRSKLASK